MAQIIAEWVARYGLLDPYGECQCGCGAKAPIAKSTNSRFGHRKGEPVRYVQSHHNNRTNSLRDAFYAHCSTTETGQCWRWNGRLGHGGYGRLGYSRKTYMAHRLSYELHYGSIPDGLWVCHHCDNPRCVNPAHLFLGTPADNTTDMIRKDRNARGEKQTNAKLTEAQVREILRLRNEGVGNIALAEQFGVGKTHISHIVTGRKWKHVHAAIRAKDEAATPHYAERMGF